MKGVVGLCLAFLLFAGCGRQSDVLEQGISLRQRLLMGNGCRFSAEVTADYGDKYYVFSMDCQSDKSGSVAFQVTAPETIGGIAGELSAEGGKLTFDDTLLQFDMLAEDLMTPVSAPWVLVSGLRGGYLRTGGQDGDLYRLTLNHNYQDDAMQLDVWLEEGGSPVRCEILHDGRRILSMQIRSFEIL